jgi:hypothetical protein
MSVFLAAMLLAAQPAIPAQTGAPAAQKKKPQQVCEMIEITGSRSKRRVCRDINGDLDLGPGVSDSAFGKANLRQSGTGSSMSSVPQ